MSEKNFLLYFNEIKQILSNDQNKEKFLKKFKSCLTDEIDENTKNSIFCEIEKIKNIKIGAYTQTNQMKKLSESQNKCYDDIIAN